MPVHQSVGITEVDSSSTSGSAEKLLRSVVTQIRNRPLRVLYFDHTAAPSGGEIALFNLIRFLDRSQVMPIVVLGAHGPLEDKLAGVCETHVLSLAADVAGARKDGLGLRSIFRLKDTISCVAYTLKLARFIARHNIDIVHTNSLKADIIGGVAARVARRPVVWHVRDRIESDYLPAKVVRLFRFLCRKIPQYVIANSRATLSTLQLHRMQVSSVVVHDGLSLDHSLEGESRPDAPVIALIGRISPWKGQHVFIEAASLVRKYFPNARFKIVGTPLFGEQDYEEKIRSQCRMVGLDDVLEFTGFCYDVDRVIGHSDLIVHASTIAEPFGQVIIEAMAAAKPVVATEGGGVPEIVIHGETGLLVPMGDASAMGKAICSVLSRPDFAAQMGQKGRERVRRHFTIQETARSVQTVYQQMRTLRSWS